MVRNLLDNSDFRNPVNQRGLTATSSNGYFIDRWVNYTGDQMLTTDGIKVTANTTPAFLSQYISKLQNGIYTFAAKVDGNIRTRIIQISETTISTVSNAEADYSGGYLSAAYQSGYGLFEFIIRVNAGYNISVEWAALYEGAYTADTLPAYQPKGYAAELAECRRYYQPVPATFAGRVTDATSVLAEFPLYPPMRIAPTIQITSAGTVHTTNGAKVGNFSYATISTTEKAGCVFYAEGITIGMPAVVADVVGYVSADL